MNTVSIPRKITKGEELVVIPKKVYRELLQRQKTEKPPLKFKTVKPTLAEVREFKRAQKDYQEGKFITLDELKRELGLKG